MTPDSSIPSKGAGPIYCIGDSHVSFFSGADQIQPIWPQRSADGLRYFQTFHVGAALAYNLGRAGTKTRGREQVWEVLRTVVPPAGRVLLCFGEIDCRAHLLGQAARRQLSPAEVASDCAAFYFEAVNEIRSAGFPVIVYNAIPSRRKSGKASDPDDEFPTVGSCRERNEVSRYFNDALARLCAESSTCFLSTFDAFVDDQGLTREWFYMDRIHLSQRAMPVTLQALRSVCPELSIPDQGNVSPPSSWQRWRDFVARRRNRLARELGKAAKKLRRNSD